MQQRRHPDTPRRDHHGRQRPLGRGARLGRVAGHARGARRVTEIVRACPDLGVTHLTLYAFSTENWRRPLAEVEGLMRIFRQYIREQDGRPAPQRRAGAVHRHAPPRAAAAARADGDARGAHARLPRPEPDDRHRLRRPRRADPGGPRRCRAQVAGGRAGARRRSARRRSAARSTPAACPTRTSSSAPRASSGSRTSCSGRGPMPSTTSRDRLARLRRRQLRRGDRRPSGARSRRFGRVRRIAAALAVSRGEPQEIRSRSPRRSSSFRRRQHDRRARGRLKRGRAAPGDPREPAAAGRPGLVAGRGDLPDLPALVPGLERRRRRRPRRHHPPPALRRQPRGRRDLDLAVLSLADARLRLRRDELPRRRPDVRHPRRLRRADRSGRTSSGSG